MTSERLYRFLLKAYPSEYRGKYEEAMAQCFRDQLRAANTIGTWVGLWLRTMADFALSLPARHLERGSADSRGRCSALSTAEGRARHLGRRDVRLCVD